MECIQNDIETIKMPPKESPSPELLVTWAGDDEAGRTKAMSVYNSAFGGNTTVVRESSIGSTYYRDQRTGTHVRDDFDRSDYEYYRDGERAPKGVREAITFCNRAYDEHGIIRNVIDLMSDFTTQGIRVIHPNKSIERFYQRWFQKVGARERSQHFIRSFYLSGNVFVKKSTAKVPLTKQKKMQSVSGEADIPLPIEENPPSREIPWQYTFLNPSSVEILGDELSSFINPLDVRIGIKISRKIANKIKNPKTAEEKELVAKISEDIKKAVRSKNSVVPISSAKVASFFYKKFDWDTWATPMLKPIATDLSLLSKMKLADASALDGIISCIRVWKIGDIEAKLWPTQDAVNRLSEMLMQNVEGGVMDLIWGPELTFDQTSTDAHQFLGNEKYGPTLSAIYAGLGIPGTLVGSETKGGFTNNAMSLKTLTERLQYGRETLVNFWSREIEAVQKAMGFARPATLEFDRIILTDEAAEKKLYLDLCDRGILSEQTLVERFGEDPEVEEYRLKRERKLRKKGALDPKSGPFHQGDNKGEPGKGRELGQKDGTKRKAKRVLPRGASAQAEMLHNISWSNSAHQTIGKLLTEPYLKSIGKKSLREVTTAEASNFEKFKFSVLCAYRVGDEVNKSTIASVLKQDLSIPKDLATLVNHTVGKYVSRNGREPTIETLRGFQSAAFACYSMKEELLDGDD